jgi:Fe-S cluster assembly protein SufB
MEWVQGSLGSKITMTYPSSILRGEYASTSNLNVALAIGPVWKDNGAKVVHAAPNTSSKVVAKSISGKGGMSVYRGQLRINSGAYNSKASVQCDALILDDVSKSNTYPHNEVLEQSAAFSHEASVGKISEEQVDYLMSRGIREEDARSLIVLGFLDDVLKEIPLEYSIEFNKLIKLEMGKYGAVG